MRDVERVCLPRKSLQRITPGSILERHRVLKPGGCIAILGTDWRGVVLNSPNEVLSGRMFDARNDAVPSPKLPVQLEPLLNKQEFTAIHVEPIPILNRSYRLRNFSVDTLEWVRPLCPKTGGSHQKSGSDVVGGLLQIRRK